VRHVCALLPAEAAIMADAAAGGFGGSTDAHVVGNAGPVGDIVVGSWSL
jgi:hypothetical protein